MSVPDKLWSPAQVASGDMPHIVDMMRCEQVKVSTPPGKRQLEEKVNSLVTMQVLVSVLYSRPFYDFMDCDGLCVLGCYISNLLSSGRFLGFCHLCITEGWNPGSSPERSF